MAWTISWPIPFSMTRRICLKYLPKTKTFPPKERLDLSLLENLNIFVNVQSKTTKSCLWVIGTSSQIMNLVLDINSTKRISYFMLQITSWSTSFGIWILECVVLPPRINKTTILLDVTVKTIYSFDLSVAEIALQRKVLPIPP